MQTWIDSIHLLKENMLLNQHENVGFLPLSTIIWLEWSKETKNPPQIMFLFQEIIAYYIIIGSKKVLL